jgi:sugar O-acyltransferase (sialic acid O-acetyltransferase NeuD family)
MAKRLYIIGAGGHGKVVADAALLQEIWDDIYFVDDSYPSLTSVMGLKVVAKTNSLDQFCDPYSEAIVAIGDNESRQRLQEHCIAHGMPLATVIHPRAVVAKSAHIKSGTVVFAGAVINAEAQIGHAVIVNTSAVIEHDCVVGDWSHICPKVGCAGGAQVGSHVWVGMGATIIQNVIIGDYAKVGAGAVVLRDVGNHQQVVGVPARERVVV